MLMLLVVTFGCAEDPALRPLQLPLPYVIEESSSNNGIGGHVLYVDKKIDGGSCQTYDQLRRLCAEGTGHAYRTIAAALNDAGPGDTVVLREGTYTERIIPVHSGSSSAPLVIRNSRGEQAVITAVNEPAIFLKDKRYIHIQGLTVDNVIGWGRFEDSAYNVIQGNTFDRALARGTTGGVKLVRSHFNDIVGNTFGRGNDSIVIQESDRNRVLENSFTWARHSLISIRCGSLNIVRGNRFHNERQKGVEIYDCEGVSDAPFRLDATQRNLVEENHFTYTRGPSQPHKYNAIQYGGQFGIVRNNYFYDNRGGGINIQVYPQEALYNYGHRIYNNTFYKNSCYGLAASKGPGEVYGDIVVVNNLFYGNTDCKGNDRQTALKDPWAVDFVNNSVLSDGEDPQFISAEQRNLLLRRDSKLKGKGAFLTRTTSAGKGRDLPVVDVKYFFDGFQIREEEGDLIQLEGTSQRFRIVSIDFDKKLLKLDQPLEWKEGQGVALPYETTAPDIGVAVNPRID